MAAASVVAVLVVSVNTMDAFLLWDSSAAARCDRCAVLSVFGDVVTSESLVCH